MIADHITQLASLEGSSAAMVRPVAPGGRGLEEFAGAAEWDRRLRAALDLFSVCWECSRPSVCWECDGPSDARIVVGEYTIAVQREGSEVVAVAFRTGHPISKSLRRTIKRMAKRGRAS